MSLRLEMLQVARMAPSLLRDSSTLVHDFISAQLLAGGGFADRSGQPDLYYTVFGVECLLALRAALPLDRLVPYLEGFAAGEDLDFVHLACLARARASAGLKSEPPLERQMAERLEAHRTGDGGYHPDPGRERGSAYAAFLALGAYQDLGIELPDPGRLLDSLEALHAQGGGYANDAAVSLGTTTATAAAIALQRQLGAPSPADAGAWLEERFHPSGGFLAAPRAPMPDLLSTATALHALSGLERSIEPFRDPCLDFIDSLWTNRGGFHGHWADDVLDCEYTYYGLLALGHLSL